MAVCCGPFWALGYLKFPRTLFALIALGRGSLRVYRNQLLVSVSAVLPWRKLSSSACTVVVRRALVTALAFPVAIISCHISEVLRGVELIDTVLSLLLKAYVKEILKNWRSKRGDTRLRLIPQLDHPQKSAHRM